MAGAGPCVALCSAVAIDMRQGAVPGWVHLLPAGLIRTLDGRGPYMVKSLQALAATLQPGAKLPIDECHSIDRAAPMGLAAPARGWIVALQARGDGLWGKVEWTGEGRRLMADKAYAGISPAVMHSKSGEITQVLRASLTNTPNLQGLTALHAQGTGARYAIPLPAPRDFDETDRLVMTMFSMNEADYRAALGAQNLKKQAL